jgi:molybdate transport system substrate-binding protein
VARKFLERVSSAAAACALVAACGEREGQPVELDVFAATSLREACTELGPLFEAAHPGVRLVFNFGASNMLAEQLIASTHGGVFLSADGLQVDRVELSGRMLDGSRREFLANTLVVVVPADAPVERTPVRPEELATDTYRILSLGHPEGVPAGRYARMWLTNLGLWDDVEHKVVPAIDVRAALMAVESGAADAGIGYATDAAVVTGVRVAFAVEGPAAPDVRYHAAAVKPGSLTQSQETSDGLRRSAALALLEFLVGEPAQRVFATHGFLPLPGAG